MTKLNISKFKFGIELESNIDVDNVDETVTFEKGWWVKDEHCGSEIISPPLVGYKGLMSLRNQLRNLWKGRKSISFQDCGLHIHVDIQHFNMGDIKRLMLLANRFDQTIFCMMESTRWRNSYSRRIEYDEEKIRKATSLRQLQSIQYGGDRYAGLNLMAFPKHGTIEFRYLMGTADWQKIYSIISMYLRMVAFSRTRTEIPTVTPVNEDRASIVWIKNKNALIPKLALNCTKFFNILQISGNTRDVLTDMFNTNAFDFSKKIRGRQRDTESQENIKFSLKRN